jgi:CheY-like chemotaxis protein
MIERSRLDGCVMEPTDDQHHARQGIFLLEDSPGETELLCQALRCTLDDLEGFHPPRPILLTTKHTADQALAWLKLAAEHEQAVLPELIIADLNLPGNSGKVFFREVRNDPRLSQLPLIVMMWSSEDQAGLTVRDGDPVDFMIKPLRLDDLVEHLHSILERRFQHNKLL